MQPTTVEYIVAYKNGEVIFEEEYPYVIFEEEGEMDDEGGYPIDKEATKAIRSKLEADKKEWFPTLYQKSEHLNSDGENIVWQPSSEEVAKEPSEKLTEKEKRLLSSMFEYLRLIGFVDADLNKLYRKLSVKDKKELQKLIIFGKKIEEEERGKNE